MHIDEAGCHHHPRRVNHLSGRRIPQASGVGNLAVLNGHRAFIPGAAAAVDDPRVQNQQVISWRLAKV